MKTLCAALLLLCGSAAAAFAQLAPSPNDPMWRYQAWMETAGLAKPSALGLYSSGPRATDVRGPWGSGRPAPAPRTFGQGISVRLTPTELGDAYNSAFPQSFNTGGIWYGVGFTPWLKAGIEAQWGWFTLRLAPQVWFSQNGSFALGPTYTATNANLSAPSFDNIPGIDQPQRYGSSPFAWWDWGDSELKMRYGVALLSFSTSNLWYGPAMFNPLILSSQAEGFPHIRLGVEDWRTGIGTFEGNLVYGQLTASQYYATDNGPRFFGGLFLDYRPSFFPQLTIGIARTIFSYWSALDWQIPVTLFDFIPFYANNPIKYGTGASHQHISFTFRLLFPKAEFEVYGEWGRNDFNPTLKSYLEDLQHQSAYMIGMRKAFRLRGGAILGVGAEMTDQSQNLEGLISGNGFNLYGDWNSHNAIQEGYTNNGQVLGGGIGNGSAETLYADAYWRNWHWGLALTRYNPETSVPYLPYVAPATRPLTIVYTLDTQLIVTPMADLKVGKWLFSVSAPNTFELNRSFVENNNVYNLQVVTSARYTW